jgi:hypothetical protein
MMIKDLITEPHYSLAVINTQRNNYTKKIHLMGEVHHTV